MKGLRRYEPGQPHAFEHLLGLGDQLTAEDPDAERRLDGMIDALVECYAEVVGEASSSFDPDMQNVLKHVDGNQVQAAQVLGISRTTLRNRLSELELGGPSAGADDAT